MLTRHPLCTPPAPPVHRRVAAWALMGAMALGACTAPVAPTPDLSPSYRDQSTPIGVTARFDETKFKGLWHLRGYLPTKEKFDQMAFRVDSKGPQVRLAAFVCDPAGVCGHFAEDLKTRRVGKGRYVIQTLEGADRDLWVLWVDEGFRTAVIGNPAGTYAWIIDRAAKGGGDRIKAAREILDFNGYNVSQLKVK